MFSAASAWRAVSLSATDAAAMASAASLPSHEQQQHEKLIGLTLAMTSSVLIGCSFVLTKVGLRDTSRQLAPGETAGDSHAYLKNYKWWCGMITMALGEASNFAAYSFAPAILVTPLGALSVLIGAVLAHFFLGERLGRQGVIGCALCVIGSVIIVLHAPEEMVIESVDEIMRYVVAPGFLIYSFIVVGTSAYLIRHVAPVQGKENMLVYITICSFVGSISVMAAKAFGVALKLTFSGSNQLGYISTWVFAAIVAGSAVTQMNYFNKALDTFSTNLVTPIYYVMFTTATIVASIVLFQGFDGSDAIDVVSVFCGFATIFIGVFMLNAKGAEEAQAKRAASEGNTLAGMTSKSVRLSSGGSAAALAGGSVATAVMGATKPGGTRAAAEIMQMARFADDDDRKPFVLAADDDQDD